MSVSSSCDVVQAFLIWINIQFKIDFSVAFAGQ